jgi:hypothetical protein
MTNSLHGSFLQVPGLFLVQFRQVTLFIQLYCTIIHNSSDKVAKQKNKYKTKNIGLIPCHDNSLTIPLLLLNNNHMLTFLVKATLHCERPFNIPPPPKKSKYLFPKNKCLLFDHVTNYHMITT